MPYDSGREPALSYHDLAELMLRVEHSGQDIEYDFGSELEANRCRGILYQIRKDFQLQNSPIAIRKNGTKLAIRKAPLLAAI